MILTSLLLIQNAHKDKNTSLYIISQQTTPKQIPAPFGNELILFMVHVLSATIIEILQ